MLQTFIIKNYHIPFLARIDGKLHTLFLVVLPKASLHNPGSTEQIHIVIKLQFSIILSLFFRQQNISARLNTDLTIMTFKHDSIMQWKLPSENLFFLGPTFHLVQQFHPNEGSHHQQLTMSDIYKQMIKSHYIYFPCYCIYLILSSSDLFKSMSCILDIQFSKNIN